MAAGGARIGAGRKPKADEDKLIQSLAVYDDIVREKLIQGVMDGNYKFIELFLAYRYGKPKQQLDVTTDGDKLNQLMIVPESVANQLLSDIPNDLDASGPENKLIT